MGCAASPVIVTSLEDIITRFFSGLGGKAMRSDFRFDRQSRISLLSTVHGLDAGGTPGKSDFFHCVLSTYCSYNSCRSLIGDCHVTALVPSPAGTAGDLCQARPAVVAGARSEGSAAAQGPSRALAGGGGGGGGGGTVWVPPGVRTRTPATATGTAGE